MAENADQFLNVLIKLGLIGQDKVEEAKAALASIAKSTGEVSQETEKQTKSTEDLGDEQKKTANITEQLEKHHRQLHEIMHILGSETAPQLGRALMGAFEGPIGLVVSFGFILELVSQKLDAFNKSMDDAGEAAANSGFKDGLEAQKTALTDAQTALDDYENSLAKIAAHEISIAQALQTQLGLIQAVAAAQAAAAKAEEEAAKAQTERKQKAGEITPEQAVIKQAPADINAVKAEAAAKQKEANDEVAAKQLAFQNAVNRQPDLDAAAKAAVEKSNEDDAHVKRVADRNKATQDEYAKEKAQQEANDKELENSYTYQMYLKTKKAHEENPNDPFATANFKSFESAVNADSQIQQWLNMKEDFEVNQMNARRMQAQYDQTQTPQAKTQRDIDKSAADAATKRSSDNQTEIEKLKDELAQARATAAAVGPAQQDEINAKIATILEQVVTKLYSTPHGGELEGGVNIAGMVAAGKNISDAQGQFLMALDQIFGGNARSMQQAAQEILKYKDDPAAFYAAVTAMVANSHSNMQRQLDELAAKINLPHGQ